MNSFNKKINKNERVSNKENFAPLSSYTPKKRMLNNNSDLQEKQIQAKNCLYQLSQDAFNTLYSNTFNNGKNQFVEQKVKPAKKWSLKQNKKKSDFSPWAQNKMKNSLRIRNDNYQNQQKYEKTFDDRNLYEKLQGHEVFVKKKSLNLLRREDQNQQNFDSLRQWQNNYQKVESQVTKNFLKDFRRPKCKSTITRYPSQKSQNMGANYNLSNDYLGQNFNESENQNRKSNNLSVKQRTKKNSIKKMSNHQKTEPIYKENKDSSSQLKFINQTVLIYDNHGKFEPQFEDNSLQNNIYDHILKKMKTRHIFQESDKKLQQMKKLESYSKKYHNSSSKTSNVNNLQNIKICIDFQKSKNTDSKIKKNIDEIMQKINPSFGKTIKKQIVKAIQKEGIKGFFSKSKQNRHAPTSQMPSNCNQFRQLIRLPKKSRPKLKSKSSLNQSQALNTYETNNPLTKLLYQKYIYTISKTNQGKIQKIH